VEFLVILFFCGLSAGTIGKIKGSSFLLWFAVGFFLPLIGTIAAVASRNERDEPTRACPECGSVVKLHDQVCMRCGNDLDWPAELA
jgi:DNA-directed RNA polymerase subunit RPC12/RpoP